MRKKGYTLIEFVLVAAILLIAVTAAISLYLNMDKSYKTIIGYLGSYLKGREVIDIMSKDCRIAVRVMDNYAGYTTTDNCLILKVPSVDSSGNIIDVNNDFDHIVYMLNGGDLWKAVIPGSSSSRTAFNDVLKNSMETLYITSNGVPLSNIVHKSTITNLTFGVSVIETISGREYKIEPGTTVKLMNYEWEFVR
jgi:prepilin-type N-terminal cleavage/methylation domain-containing protein